ncbi:MAG: hypothetical protein JWO89_1961 [Verrucomicrobiaceae bacterium]|nr:hypothetical protein [Verrucomicrobiaceae bacterium]
MDERPPISRPLSEAAENARSKKTVAFWTVVAVSMLAMALSTPFVGRKIYHKYVTYRAEQIAAAAALLLEEERWEAASQALRQDFQTYGREPSVLRALATLFLDGYADPMVGANLLRQVLASGQGTFDDSRRLALATLKVGDTPEARRLYETLPEAERTNRKGLELLAGIQQQSGETSLADKTLRKALTLEPDDPRSQFRLALMDEASAFEVSKTVASQAVWAIARGNDSLALEAIAHLCASPSLTTPQVQELLVLVEQNRKAAARDRYRVLSASLRLRPLEREKVVAAEVAKNKRVPADKLFDFLRWLGTEKQYQQIIELVDAKTAVRDPDLFLVYVDALSAADRWKELLAMIKENKVPVSEAMLHFISAECCVRLKPTLSEAAEHIERVYSSASISDLQTVDRAAALAEARGLNALAITGYGRLAEQRPNLRVGMLEKVLELQQREKDAPAILGTLKQLRELRPANHAYIDRLNYLRLVTGDEMELAFEAVCGFEKPAVAMKDSPVVPQALLRALAAMRMGQPHRAAEEVRTLDSTLRLSAGQRAVMAGMTAEAGEDVKAFRMAESIPPALLLPDELVFLRRALTK